VLSNVYTRKKIDSCFLISRSSRTTLAVLLKRFEERIQQWEMIREFFITTTWSKNCKKNFYRQFDMKLFTFRFAVDVMLFFLKKKQSVK
jgi:hypothetical protein